MHKKWGAVCILFVCQRTGHFNHGKQLKNQISLTGGHLSTSMSMLTSRSQQHKA